MNAGRLSKFVMFEKKVVTVDGQGLRHEHWELDTAIGNNGMLSAEPQRLTETNARFTVRYRTDIEVGFHRIVFWGARWNVVNAIPDLRDSFTVLESDFSEKIEVTSMDSEVKEWVDGHPTVHP
jgi:head-tail adaptor